MRHSQHTPTEDEIWGVYQDDDMREELMDEIEFEWSGEFRSGMHPKKGRSTNARRYIEEYWENKRLREAQEDILDLD